ncbi:hypothetical protein IP92_04259 [Pseudoduganella flava]|uniref:DUF1453 domain-containing protein n=2 Tax=Pseudoduganella flava TaxID=871742 RepID=A0A562PIP6_9BURK|nr:DUF6622 family protein [Pseudoduganella flava]QGZ41908.1 hypothetical protein GO485_24520 [Pseudoduganella flava]TWI44314.1 hypothetical protein IP92_04259 [Pseudoduganella flava]
MLQQIVTHTPIYVWLLLAFLVSRGIAASRDRVLPLRRVFVIPAVLLVLSVQDMAHRFGLDAAPVLGWLAGASAATLLAWRATAPAQVDRAAGTVLQRGSWLPLALMLATFVTKYAVAVACAVRPDLAAGAGFAATAGALYGVFNGLFVGRALRCLPRAAATPAHINAMS